MKTQDISTYEEFQADPERRKLLIEEALLLEVTERICEYMEREKVTRSELARRLKVTNGYITQILSGSRNISLRKLAHVADALGYEVEMRFKRRQQEKAECFSYEIDLVQAREDYPEYSLKQSLAGGARLSDCAFSHIA